MHHSIYKTSKLILFSILICITESSFCQDYRKGYVITSAGDTLVGSVEFREGQKAYKFCKFKSSESQAAVTYEPSDILGYGFTNDKVFQSRKIQVEDQRTTVFLEQLIRGRVSLYKFRNVFFVEKDSSGLQQLKNETEELFVNGRHVVRATNEYVGVLNTLLVDCPAVSGKIRDTQLNYRALSDLITDYNRCNGNQEIVYKAKKPWTKFLFGVTGGVNISRLSVEPNEQYPQLNGNFSNNYKSPIAGISFDGFSPRINERISFHADVLYTQGKYYYYTFLAPPYGLTERDYVTIELQQLKIPVGIRYSIPGARFTPYINIGISTTVNLKTRSQWTQEIESTHLIETHTDNPLPIPKNQIGLWGSLGASKSITSKLAAFVELRYEQTNGISHDGLGLQPDIDSKIINIQLLIGIRTR